MKRVKGFQFIVGFLLGALMFGGSVAVASGILAQPATNQFVIDGKEVKLEAYIIEGRNYLQLRDLDAALKPGSKDFSVVWDGANNRVIIDTTRGYDPNEQVPSSRTTYPTMTIEEMKAEIVRLTNAERVKAGVPELEILPALMDCAQAKAQDFIDNHYYGHDSPIYGSSGQMIKAAIPQAKSAGENIAPWRETAQGVFDEWMDSQGHRANILAAKYTHIGVGIIEGANGGYWWVQQFVGL